MNDTIEAIKSKLQYSNDEERESAYASWFIVVAVLADAYADAGMSKEETICRWIVRERKIPWANMAGEYTWWWSSINKRINVKHIIPLEWCYKNYSLFYGNGVLLFCLDSLLSTPDEYLGRFH